MASLRDIPLRQGYSSGRYDLPREFYVPCLDASITYDRAVGYFRSTLYALTGLAFSDFALRNGRCRLVCSPTLSPEDAAAIARGESIASVVDRSLHAEITRLLENPDSLPASEFLATLIAYSALEIRFAVRPDCTGIFHDKVGIFRDANSDSLTFVGSANETFSAWSPGVNHEAFETFASWGGSSDAERVARHSQYFESLWEDREPTVRTVTFAGASREKLLTLANSEGINSAADRFRSQITKAGVAEAEPQPETPRALMPHQIETLANWVRAGHRGVVNHATGVGKTITALAAARSWLEQNRPVIILVPSDLLLQQWRNEAARELRGCHPTVFVVGGGTPRSAWLEDLRAATSDDSHLGPRLILATIQTACTEMFRSRVSTGPHLLVIADEMHRLGSASFRAVLDLDAGGRLGLSASPDRFGDAEGTDALRGYFGDVLSPVVTLADGISMGRLVPYEYFVHPVRLTATEQDEWNQVTEEISIAFARLHQPNQPDGDLPDRLRLMLIRRARILKQADNKVAAALAITRSHYSDGSRWLLYCDSREQVLALLRALTEAGLPAFEYTSLMDSPRDETLERFVDIGGILVAVRCLDEGVDIPTINCAVILASSTNPREFIQRRGRILRVASGKYSAIIHDLVVFPYDPAVSAGAFVDGVFVRELSRARMFAETARNLAVKYILDEWTRRLVQKDSLDEVADQEGEDSNGVA